MGDVARRSDKNEVAALRVTLMAVTIMCRVATVRSRPTSTVVPGSAMKTRSFCSWIPLGLVMPVLAIIAAPAELACACCSESVCDDGITPELKVVLGPEFEEGVVSTNGACTQVERAERSGGNTIWRGAMTASDRPCVVTVTLNGAQTQQTIQSPAMCGGPGPATACFGAPTWC